MARTAKTVILLARALFLCDSATDWALGCRSIVPKPIVPVAINGSLCHILCSVSNHLNFCLLKPASVSCCRLEGLLSSEQYLTMYEGANNDRKNKRTGTALRPEACPRIVRDRWQKDEYRNYCPSRRIGVRYSTVVGCPSYCSWSNARRANSTASSTDIADHSISLGPRAPSRYSFAESAIQSPHASTETVRLPSSSAWIE